jgi:hypothetical protein
VRAAGRLSGNPHLSRHSAPGDSAGPELSDLIDVHGDAWPTQSPALRARRGQSGSHTALNQLPFELGDTGEVPERQPEVRRARVDAFVK